MLSWPIATALAVSVGSGVAFVRRQNRSATPMLDMKLFGYAPFSSSILANFLSIVGLIGFIFFVSQHLQLVLGLSPLAAGLVTLPGAVLSMVAASQWCGSWSGCAGRAVGGLLLVITKLE
jgi:DHA2 family multidrug resistance protein-like MFS transporter